jgi:hypothetical protein
MNTNFTAQWSDILTEHWKNVSLLSVQHYGTLILKLLKFPAYDISGKLSVAGSLNNITKYEGM